LCPPTGAALLFAFHTTDESFVGLNSFASTAHWGHADNTHGLTDAVRHEPSGFQSDAQGTRKLVTADTLLARAKKEDRLQPYAHRDVAVLEDGPDLHGKLFAALVALVGANPSAFALHLGDAI
jgi:hypothetical protein